MKTDYSKLKRQRYSVPDFVKNALEKHGLMKKYNERPAYQKNDYIGWINSAKKQETKDKRLNQMLDELKKGGIYMKMKHSPSEI
ncbi:MAG: YdeI/OmpD-associated family protein [Gammaproteobacteria bacterium]|nr:YdeI/OmpD-associated family protein [Gammaproteobacteria bacterium]